MGVSSSKSKASTTDNRIAATDQAQVVQGSAKLVEEGAVSVSEGSQVNTGLQLSNVGTGAVVNIGGADMLLEANRDWLSSLSGFNDSLSAVAASGTDSLNAALASLKDLAESKQTDGESGKNNMLLYVALGAMALGAVYIVKK